MLPTLTAASQDCPGGQICLVKTETRRILLRSQFHISHHNLSGILITCGRAAILRLAAGGGVPATRSLTSNANSDRLTVKRRQFDRITIQSPLVSIVALVENRGKALRQSGLTLAIARIDHDTSVDWGKRTDSLPSAVECCQKSRWTRIFP